MSYSEMDPALNDFASLMDLCKRSRFSLGPATSE